MPDKNLTDNEIIKNCENCLHYNICCLWSTTDLIKEEQHKYCFGNFKDKDLINRLQAEKQDLEIELKAMRGSANSYKADNERLKNTIAIFTNNAVDFANEIDRHKKDKEDAFQFAADIVNAEKIVVAQAKAEAYKEFAERLKEKCGYDKRTALWNFEKSFKEKIDNLLKEMGVENAEE